MRGVDRRAAADGEQRVGLGRDLDPVGRDLRPARGVRQVERVPALARDEQRPLDAELREHGGQLGRATSGRSSSACARARTRGRRGRSASRRGRWSGRGRCRARAASPSTRAAASVPAARSDSTDVLEMKVTPKPALTAVMTDSCRPSSRRTSRSRSRMPTRRSSSSIICRTPAPSCITISVSARISSSVTVRPANGWPGRAGEDHLVVEERLEDDAAVPPPGADDAELELARGDALDDRLRVEDVERDVQLGVALLELAEQVREHDPAGPVDAPMSNVPVELVAALERDVGEHLLLEREQPLRADGRAASRPRSARRGAPSGRAAASRAASRARAPGG